VCVRERERQTDRDIEIFSLRLTERSKFDTQYEKDRLMIIDR
jgi:hypothetical protein